MGVIGGMVERNEVALSRLDDALAAVPSGGLAYLPTASYREMESWALPPDAAVRLAHLERDLGVARVAGPDGALIRGTHWRNFLVKYPESNRMQKKMMALSALARERGDPAEVRRAIGRAQCNDAYWHGVFGGLYLPHLRDAVWRNLAAAEAGLRQNEPLAWEVTDFVGDGYDEVWVHSAAFSAVVSPARGGAIEEYTVFARGINYANTLTRRREAYHDLALERAAEQPQDHGAAASIHAIEEGLRLDVRPALDHHDRALFVDAVLPRGVTFDEYVRGGYWSVGSWARRPLSCTVERQGEAVEVACSEEGAARRFEKRLRFEADGRLSVRWTWNSSVAEPDDLFATEISLAAPVRLDCTPAADEWRFPIETVAKSERGLDRTRQGESVTLRWPVRLGTAGVSVEPA
jgi:alpha-amylase